MSSKVDEQNRARREDAIKQEAIRQGATRKIDTTKQAKFKNAIQSAARVRVASEGQKAAPTKKESQLQQVTRRLQANKSTNESSTDQQINETTDLKAQEIENEQKMSEEAKDLNRFAERGTEKKPAAKSDSGQPKTTKSKKPSEKESDTKPAQKLNLTSDDFFANAVSFATQKPEGAAASTTSTVDMDLNELADRIFVGVNQKGLTEMTIELKQGFLNGSTIQVSASEKKVYLKFQGLNKASKRLLNSSTKILSERLAQRSLHLENLTLED